LTAAHPPVKSVPCCGLTFHYNFVVICDPAIWSIKACPCTFRSEFLVRLLGGEHFKVLGFRHDTHILKLVNVLFR
ncbi:hypothetical protein ACFQ71_42140, partial [Streptomyces sp. NPDC056534]|uniref:hypothetical protein n=1 Tax=Streptomyces sp. NPDC056534 TaxID=3345857 RepID=UPI0036BCBB5A